MQIAEDMLLFHKFIEKGLIDKLKSVLDNQFGHISYTEAIDVLIEADKRFDFPVS